MNFSIDDYQQIKGESSKNYSLFLAYANLGNTRTLKRLAIAESKSESYLKRLSSQWFWHDRCVVYDASINAELARISKQEHLALIKAHLAARSASADKVFHTATLFLNKLADKLDSLDRASFDRTTPFELSTLFKNLTLIIASTMQESAHALSIRELLQAIDPCNTNQVS